MGNPLLTALTSGVSSLIIGIWRTKKIQEWAKLLFTMAFSATVAFLAAMGKALIAGSGLLVAIGYGEIAAAVALVGLFLISPLTRGMMVSVPKDVVEKFQQQDDQVKIEHK